MRSYISVLPSLPYVARLGLGLCPWWVTGKIMCKMKLSKFDKPVQRQRIYNGIPRMVVHSLKTYYIQSCVSFNTCYCCWNVITYFITTCLSSKLFSNGFLKDALRNKWDFYLWNPGRSLFSSLLSPMLQQRLSQLSHPKVITHLYLKNRIDKIE